MNTVFQKRGVCISTHGSSQASRVWHCIDCILMRYSQRRKCQVVQAMRGVECFTEHRLESSVADQSSEV